MIAAEGGHPEIVEFLLGNSDLKIDVNIRDTDSHTPLMLACGTSKESITEKHVRAIHLLLAGGAQVNAEDDGGYTALDLAVINNNIEAVKLLLEYKANVNHQNQDRFTPLHSACRYALQEISTLLVAHGADLSIPDGQSRTPVQLAQRYGVVLSLSSPTIPSSSASPQPQLAAASKISTPPPTTTYSSSESSQTTLSLQAELEAELSGAESVTPTEAAPVSSTAPLPSVDSSS